MVEDDSVESGEELPLEGVGQKLRRARERQGLTLDQLAEETRISLRHLEFIEKGEFSRLPARTYAIGFTRTCARVLGLDDEQLIDELRYELAENGNRRPAYTPAFEPGDPAKAPPVGVIWASAIAALLLALGAYAFYASYFAPGAEPAPLVADAQPAPENGVSAANANSAAAPSAPPEQVVFTALEEGVWVSFYEADGQRLEQKLMSEGERFVVPPEAQEPRIWTGRPDALAITIGGKQVPKLSEDRIVIRDVAITAEALRARGERPETGANEGIASDAGAGNEADATSAAATG